MSADIMQRTYCQKNTKPRLIVIEIVNGQTLPIATLSLNPNMAQAVVKDQEPNHRHEPQQQKNKKTTTMTQLQLQQQHQQ
jgi:hypothetical protein